MLVVNAHCGTVASKQLGWLVQGDAGHRILRAEQVGLWLATLRIIAIVNLMASEVGVCTQCTVSPTIVVGQCYRYLATGDVLVVLQFQLGGGTRI